MKGKIAVAVLLMGIALPGFAMGDYEMAAKMQSGCQWKSKRMRDAWLTRSQTKKKITMRQFSTLNMDEIEWVNEQDNYYPGDDSAALTAYGRCIDYYLAHPELAKYF